MTLFNTLIWHIVSCPTVTVFIFLQVFIRKSCNIRDTTTPEICNICHMLSSYPFHFHFVFESYTRLCFKIFPGKCILVLIDCTINACFKDSLFASRSSCLLLNSYPRTICLPPLLSHPQQLPSCNLLYISHKINGSVS